MITQPKPQPILAWDDTGSLLSGTIAVVLASAFPLGRGLIAGWPMWRLLAYAGAALLLVVLTFIPVVPLRPARWLCQRRWPFLLLGGALGLVLQALTGDPFMQPIVFSVLFVHGALLYANQPRQIVAIGALYLGLIALGQWLNGSRNVDVLILPVVSYGALFGFMYAFTQLSITQTAARAQADSLARALAHERDSLARLVEINATLARTLDLSAVLDQVAAAGHALGTASRVRIWLREHDPAMPLRLAAAMPSESPAAPPQAITSMLLATEVSNTGATLVLPLLFGGENIGALELQRASVEPFTARDGEQLRPFANAAAIAIRNAGLYEQSRMSATLVERNRLARELHDTIAQGLTAINLQLEAAQRSFDRDAERTRARIQRAADLSRDTLGDVRRSVWALAAPPVASTHLAEELASQCARFSARTGVSASATHAGLPPTIDDAAATQVLRIVQEALHNVEKHADARHVTVASHASTTALQFCVADDGVGFDPAAPRPNSQGGFGLISLQERARLAGGTLAVESALGEGTRVIVDIPFAE